MDRRNWIAVLCCISSMMFYATMVFAEVRQSVENKINLTTPSSETEPPIKKQVSPVSQTEKAANLSTPVTVVGRVVWVKGNFKAIAKDHKTRDLKRASEIYLYDTLETGKGSEAQIVFTDNTLMAFRPDTTFRIEEYQFDPKKVTEKTGKYVTSLVKGGLRTVTGWIGKANPANYEVKTPVGIIGIRGTEFSVYFGEDKKLLVQLAKGELAVSNQAGTTQLSMKMKDLYAEVAAVTQKALVLSKQPPIFKSDPAI